MHEMQTIVTDVRGVCPSVCLSRGSTRLHCAKTAERIKILLGVNTPAGPRNMLDGGPDPSTARGGDSMQESPNYFGLLLIWALKARHSVTV